MPTQFTAIYKPKPIKSSPLRDEVCQTRPIVVGRDRSQARISIVEAKELQSQLSIAIRQAEHNLIVTKKGAVLEEHYIHGFKYFTCPNQH